MDNSQASQRNIQTQSSSAKMTMEELLKKHGGTLGNKTGAILMPLSKGQREAMQTNLTDRSNQDLHNWANREETEQDGVRQGRLRNLKVRQLLKGQRGQTQSSMK